MSSCIASNPADTAQRPRVLLVDADQTHAERVRELLHLCALEADVCPGHEDAFVRLQQASSDFELVILNVSNDSLPWCTILAKLQAACLQSGVYPSPFFLCISSTRRPSEFELRIERLGARYVHEG